MRSLFSGLICVLSLLQIYSRSSIGGVVNSYYEVQSVNSLYLEALPTEDLSDLKPGDKIMLVQMSGIVVNSSPGFDTINQSYNQFLDAGHYTLLTVKNVDNGAPKRVYFTVVIDASIFTIGEKIQMVKIFEDDYVTVESTLTADNWDGRKGGIVAMVVYKKLTLNADINVSGKGFRGALPEDGFGGTCNSSKIYYYDSLIDGLAGKKGEGNPQSSWSYTKGPGRIVIGGGGGIGKFAGGGGGGNYGTGGSGGFQMIGCDTKAPTSGGLRLYAFNNFYNEERIIFGGGGGSSTWDATHSATSGGNGGGIVIIISDTIEVNNNKKIISDGITVSTPATAGGGGGGAGGSIFLDINYYKNQLGITVAGGKGGNANSGADITGAGGGGGGGILRFSQSTLPNINPVFSFGPGGVGFDVTHDGGSGTAGGYLANLKLPLNGFLFNSITGIDTICAGQSPKTIKGSTPKGGTTYSYEWLKSTDSLTWTSIPNNNPDYNPGTLNFTTWFKRIVVSGLVSDTSLSEKVYVLPVISNNILEIRDTLCYSTSPGTLNGNIVSGGSGTYNYQWQSSINQSAWSNRSIDSSLNENNLTVTTYYRRIVTSGIVTSPVLCSSTSNIDTLTILPLISGNAFNRSDTAICQNLNAGVVKALLPAGGDNTYAYRWQSSINGTIYGTVGGATSQTYSPGILSTDRYYKRIVFSGEGDVCRDTSAAFRIQVYPSITNNNITVDSTRYCSGIIPLQANGDNLSGGNSPNYVYKWRSRNPDGAWTDISGAASQNYYVTTSFIDTFQIERIVFSGRFDACKDTSNFIQVDVIPAINNILTSIDPPICEGALPLPFNENVASGGAGSGTYQYLWQDSTVASTWQSSPQDITLNNLPAYSPVNLDETTWFRRRVVSQICTSISNSIEVEVYPAIERNIIAGGANQFSCYQLQKMLNAELPGGGNNTYRYTWQQSPDNSIWSDAVTTQSYTTPALSAPVYYRRIVKSGISDQCIDTSSVILVSINPLPTGSITSAIDTVCAGESIQIIYSLTGFSPWNIKLGESGDTLITRNIDGNGSGMITYAVNETANIQILDVVDDSTCHATEKTGIFNVVAYPYPVPFAGEDGDTCGLDYRLQAIASDAENAYWSWSGSTTAFESPQNPNSLVTSDNYTEQTFTWNALNWNCPASDDVIITFFEQPASIDAGEDQLLDYEFETVLNAQEPSIGNSYWSWSESNSTIDDTTLHNAHVTLQEVGRYKFIWTIENGSCIVLNDSVFVTVGDLQIFSGFSPNGDDYNPEFVLELSGNNVTELIILDINGGLVFGTTGTEQIKWDGRSNNGKEVPEGTYFYIIKEPGVADRKGFIELRR